jgi:hypothetical protein
MPIVPDTKNWTWVLTRACPECGFDSSSLPRDQIVPLIGTTAQGWRTVLAEPAVRLRRAVTDDRWSPLEYACHVRDVFLLYDERLHLMLTQDDPTFPDWDQDRSAVDDGYNAQDPTTVSSQLVAAADALAASFAAVGGATWERPGSRSDGAHFTIDTFGRYMIHDPVHHLHEVIDDVATLTMSDPG